LKAKNLAGGFFRAVMTGSLLAALTGCAVSQTSADVEAGFVGDYKVVEQSRSNPIQVDSVHVKFSRGDNTPSAGLISVDGVSGRGGWALTRCGTPSGKRMVSIDDRSMLEVMQCDNQMHPPFPQIFLTMSKDGRPIGFHPQPLDFSNKTINAKTGRLMVIWWGPDNVTAFELAPQ
jgi:hypothetical protein